MRSLITSILAGLAYRWRGMAGGSRILKRLLICTLLAIAVAMVSPTLWALVVIPLAFPGIVMGHGSYMDLGTVEREDNEFFKPLLDKIFGLEPPFSFIRDFTGLALTGLVVTVPVALLPIVLALIPYNIGIIPLIPLWFALIGILKAVAYSIGYIINKNKATEVGEFLWGVFLVAPLFLW